MSQDNLNYRGPIQFENLVTKIVAGIKPAHPAANPEIFIGKAVTIHQLEETIARLQNRRGERGELYDVSFMALCNYSGCEINEVPKTTSESMALIEKKVVGVTYDAARDVISINPAVLYLWEEAISSRNKDIGVPAITGLRKCLDASLTVAEVYSKSKPKQVLEKLAEELEEGAAYKDIRELTERNEQLVSILKEPFYDILSAHALKDPFVKRQLGTGKHDYAEIFEAAMESPTMNEGRKEKMKEYIDADREYPDIHGKLDEMLMENKQKGDQISRIRDNHEELLNRFIPENIYPLLKVAEFVMNDKQPPYDEISNSKIKNNDAAILKSMYGVLSGLFNGVNRIKTNYSNALLKIIDHAYVNKADIKSVLKIGRK